MNNIYAHRARTATTTASPSRDKIVIYQICEIRLDNKFRLLYFNTTCDTSIVMAMLSEPKNAMETKERLRKGERTTIVNMTFYSLFHLQQPAACLLLLFICSMCVGAYMYDVCVCV